MQGEKGGQCFSYDFYQNHTDWTCNHTLKGVLPNGPLPELFDWQTAPLWDTFLQTLPGSYHAPQPFSSALPQLSVHTCDIVFVALSWNLLTRSHHSCQLTVLPQKGCMKSLPPQALEQGLAHGQLSELFVRLINRTQPMGKSLTDNKTCASRELYKTHFALSSARCPSRHLRHLTNFQRRNI